MIATVYRVPFRGIKNFLQTFNEIAAWTGDLLS
jgi:hypothetical protein